jgi:choline dehydrogenase-like flavoprotein
MADRTPSPRTDVCIVGAGPAGSLIASELSASGYDVVVLEAGERFDPADRVERMDRSLRPAHDPPSVWDMGGDRDAYTSTGERHYPLNHARVKGVGGSTLHWQGLVQRLHAVDFERQSAQGVAVDWPISYDDLRPYYARAETELGVAGALDNPFSPPREEPFPLPAFPPSYSDSLFAPACEEVGVTMHSAPTARNSEAYDGESACVGYGTCKPVCPSGAKYDATRHIERAEGRGVRVIDRAPVQSLEHGPDGERVEAAVYATPDGETHRQTARQFVVACGGVETPRLLLLSQSSAYPDGLANSSGLVGRYFMDHLFVGTGGHLDEPTRQQHIGFLTSECHQFYDDPAAGTEQGIPAADADTDALGSIKLEFFNYAGPSPADIALGAESWGDELLAELKEAYGSAIAMGGIVEQPPRREHAVGLDPERTDDHGNPVPTVDWGLDERTRRTIHRAGEIQRAILEALGAEITWQVGPEDTGPTYHHMGTTRMGTDSAESVVGPDCRTHDLANLWLAGSSVFPTGGAMNPTLTIAALALKTADHLDDRL